MPTQILGVDGSPPGGHDLVGRAMSGILGPDWASGAASIAAVGELLAQFNELIFFALSLVFMAIFTAGIVGTAHEGRPLGARLHTVWVPIRMAFSAAFLAPVPGLGGVCLLQAFLLISMGWGTGQANKMAETFLGHQGQAVLAAEYAPAATRAEAEALAAGILDAALLQVHYRNAQRPAESAAMPIGSWFRRGVEPDLVFEFSGSDNAGSITLSCPQGVNASCIRVRNAAGTLLMDMYAIAETIYHGGDDAEIADIAMSFQTDKTKVVPSRTRFNAAVSKYLSEVYIAAQEMQSEIITAQTAHSASLAQHAGLLGWASLGSYYHSISMMQSSAADAMRIPISVVPPSAMSRAVTNNAQYAYAVDVQQRYVMSSAPDLLDFTEAARGGDHGGLARLVFKYVDPVYYVASFTDSIKSENPITAASRIGHTLINGASGLYAAVVAGQIAASGIEAAASSFGKIPGLGAAASGAAGALKAASGAAAGPLLLVVAALFGAGVWLAYILPATIYLIFTVAVISTIILLIEAIIAAPLWVLGLAMPEGEGFVGSHGRQGCVLLLGVLLRPLLIVIGFALATLLLQPLAELVASGFAIFASGHAASGGSGVGRVLVGPIFYLILLAVLLSILVNKTFGLVSHLPERCVRWLGGAGAAHLSAGDDVGTARASLATAGMAGGAIGSAARSGAERASAAAAAKKATTSTAGSTEDHAQGDKSPEYSI